MLTDGYLSLIHIYPGHRYYGGCQFVDQVEQIAIDRACKLFGAKYANVQPHSGAQANLAVYFALLNLGDTVMGMDLSQGGHLTHGSPGNLLGQCIVINAAVFGRNAVGNKVVVLAAHVGGGTMGQMPPWERSMPMTVSPRLSRAK